jgi:hemolysin D
MLRFTESRLESMKSANKIIRLPRLSERRHKEDVAFLPAALEIVEAPPSPIGRAIIATIIVIFCLVLAWASLGTLDVVSSASGKIIDNGRTKVIQPFDTGVVRAIYVHDGEKVKAGDVLIELDPTSNKADVDHLRGDLTAMQFKIARLRAALSDAEDPVSAFAPPENASPSLVTMERQFLVSQIAEQRSKLAALDRQRDQKEAERETIAATIAKLEATIPIRQQTLDIRKTLMEKEIGSKILYLDTLLQVVEQQKDLGVQHSKYQEADAALSAIIQTRAQAVAEYRRKTFDDLAEAEQKGAGIAQDLVKSEQKAKLQVLIAPVDGTVQQLAVHTIGGVVTPAQNLLAVVPIGSDLQIEAMVQNRDIGFIHAGQEAEIKVDTFNFTRYGLLHGKVLSVSQDAIVQNKPQDNSGDRTQGAANSSSEPKGQELTYAARVSLDRTQMDIDGKLVNLSPGMAVTVEIKTGSRTIMSYLLSPLLRYKQDSLRER